MKNLLNKVKEHKVKIASIALTVAGFALSFAEGAIETKQLEQTVDQTVDAKIAAIINETNEEMKESEDAQNE